MKFEEYYSLIKRLEVLAGINYRSYRRRVLMMISLGYLYIGLLILLMLLPILLILTVVLMEPARLLQIALWTAKLWWAAIPATVVYFGLLGKAVRSIFTTVPQPDGIEITAAEAPDLFALIDRISDTLQSEKPRKVLVTDEFNAAVVTRPRFGMFGRQVDLLLGLPLMRSMSKEQFDAVLAHEFGHISGNHGKLSKWAYQMESSWSAIVATQSDEQDRFSVLYDKFFDWFFPRFRAYSFVLMREQEKLADRDAAALTSAEDLANSLLVTEAVAAYLQKEYWDKIHEEMSRSKDPSPKLFSRMLETIDRFDPANSDEAIKRSLSVPTDYDDSHPSTADRLKLLGVWTDETVLPTLPRNENNAADVYLGDSSSAYVPTFDRSWGEKAIDWWNSEFEHKQGVNERLNELESKDTNVLTVDELVELGYLIGQNGDAERARSLFEDAVSRFPETSSAHHFLGASKLGQGDESGIADLERAIELDTIGPSNSLEVIFSYLRSKGRMDEAAKYASKLEHEYELDRLAHQEWNYVARDNEFVSPEIDFDMKDVVEQKIGTFDEIEAIYIVRRVLKSRPEVPNHVMFVKTRKKSRLKNRDDLEPERILEIICERFDNGQINYFAMLINQFDELEKKLDTIEGAKIYQKDSSG